MFRRRPADVLTSVLSALDDYELPSFPHVITDALGRLGDPDVSMADVAAVLERDPGLSVKLLQLVNSAAMGMRNPVESLQQAVTMLGRNQVESVLITTAASTSIPRPVSSVFDPARFWRTAATRAVVASSLAGVVDPTRRSECFTAALLQDMALPVLVEHVDSYESLLERWYTGEIRDFAGAELEEFGWDHASVGADMASRWDFPESLREAIGHHHDEPGESDMVAVHLVAAWHEIDEHVGREELLANAASVPRLGGHDCAALLDDALDRVDEVAAQFC